MIANANCASGSQALDQGVGADGNHPCQAQLADQLSLFQFLQGKPAEAEANARRSLAIIQTHFPPGDPAVCMCQLRLGSILFSERPPSHYTSSFVSAMHPFAASSTSNKLCSIVRGPCRVSWQDIIETSIKWTQLFVH